MSINFDFADLEAFLAVLERGSFHLAAEALALSQSAVTRRVQKLETALDSPLFERTTRSVKPTLAAKRLRPRAEAILDDARETARAMRDDSIAFAHQRSAIVTVATIATVVPHLIVPAIERVRADGSTARVRVLDFAANAVSEAIAEGEADFGICSIPTLDPTLTFEMLFEDQMVVALPAGHRLRDAEAIRWPELAGEPLILPARGTGNRLLVDDAMARARGTLRWTFEAERSTTALAMVEGGCGVALLPRSALIAHGGTRALSRPLVDPAIARPIGLVARAGASETRDVAALKTAIRVAVNPKPAPKRR